MKLADNNDMHKISDEFKNGSARTNNGSYIPLIVKNGHYRPCEQLSFFSLCWIIMKLADINDMDKISDEFENGSDRINNSRVQASLGSYVGKPSSAYRWSGGFFPRFSGFCLPLMNNPLNISEIFLKGL